MTIDNQNMLEAVQTLHAEYHGKMADINTELNIATRRVGDARRIYFVDQTNGDDSLDGLEATPLKTIGEAALRSVWGGVLRIYLKTDYHMDAPVLFRGGDVEIMSSVWDTQRNITFSENVDPSSIGSPHFYHNDANASFRFRDSIFHSRAMTDNVLAPHMISNIGYTVTTFENCHFNAAAGDNLSVFNVRNGFGFILDNNCTYSADMPGKWVNGIAAGTAANLVPMLTHTNLATL